ncbi:MAG: hypothetical protein V1882_02055, partial [Candidatus Omnitrophota bacterium]
LAITELQVQVDLINSKLSTPDEQAKKALLKDFKSAIGRMLSGDESQPGARFGLRVVKNGPYRIEKPISISQDGRKITESRTVLITKHKNNEASLDKFQDYLRTGYNLPIDGLTFDAARKAMEKFFSNAPKHDVYGEEFETETFPESQIVATSDPGFKM